MSNLIPNILGVFVALVSVSLSYFVFSPSCKLRENFSKFFKTIF